MGDSYEVMRASTRDLKHQSRKSTRRRIRGLSLNLSVIFEVVENPTNRFMKLQVPRFDCLCDYNGPKVNKILGKTQGIECKSKLVSQSVPSLITRLEALNKNRECDNSLTLYKECIQPNNMCIKLVKNTNANTELGVTRT